MASADEKKNYYNIKQNNLFHKIVKNLNNIKYKSIANSMGIILGRSYHYDLTTAGIALYGGHYNHKNLRKKIRPVIKIKAEIIQIKKIIKNSYIGYNQTFKTKRNIFVAILGIGYGDGISRKLSNAGHVFFKNYKLRILGRVSMDSITVDISNCVNHVKKGMYIEIINHNYDIEKMAKKCGTISNELLTSISHRLQRIYK